MHSQSPNHPITRSHAIVIGGSIAGLLTARVLSDHFAQVTLIERDRMHDQPEARKGQPHTRHLHALLAKGLETMRDYFPGLLSDLLTEGAIASDMGKEMRWHTFGGYRRQFESGMIGALMSRPLLEWQIRRRVVALPNVTVLDGCDVDGLVTTADRSRVSGVQITHRNEDGRSESLSADLVVDASGRGSASPKWLTALNYGPVPESLIKVNVGYATRIYRRRPGDLIGADLILIAADMPHGKRSGLIFPIEGDRWICTLGGWIGDHAPTDEAGFLAYARSLAAPDVYEMISRLEPLSDITPYKFPGSLRRYYEKLQQFPEGYLVLGDAICSFNPVYGQGMTSAAMQAAALDQTLQASPTLDGLWRRFFKAAAKVVDIPWQLAVGEDFRFPETEGEKPAGVDFINRYITQVHRATHHDPVVYAAFLRVMNLMAAPTSLFHPRLLWRVLRPQAKSQPATRVQPEVLFVP